MFLTSIYHVSNLDLSFFIVFLPIKLACEIFTECIKYYEQYCDRSEKREPDGSPLIGNGTFFSCNSLKKLKHENPYYININFQSGLLDGSWVPSKGVNGADIFVETEDRKKPRLLSRLASLHFRERIASLGMLKDPTSLWLLVLQDLKVTPKHASTDIEMIDWMYQTLSPGMWSFILNYLGHIAHNHLKDHRFLVGYMQAQYVHYDKSKEGFENITEETAIFIGTKVYKL